MKKLTLGFLTKLTAFVLCLLCLAAATAAAAGLLIMGEAGTLHIPEKHLRENTLSQYLYSVMDDVVQLAVQSEEGASSRFNAAYSNLRYTVELDGYIIDTNLSDDHLAGTGVSLSWKCKLTELCKPAYNDPGIQSLVAQSKRPVSGLRNINAVVHLHLVEPLSFPDVFRTVDTGIRLLCAVRPYLGWIVAGGYLAAIGLLVYLFHAAGRRPGREEITLNLLDRIPADVYLAGCAGLVVLLLSLCIASIDRLSHSGGLAPGWLIPAGLSILAVLAVTLGFFLGTATRIKRGVLFKNTLIWRIFSLLGRGLRACWRGVCFLVRSIPFIWRTALLLGFILLTDFAFTVIMINLRHGEGIELCYWAIKSLLFIAAVIAVAMNLRAVRQGCRDLAEGRLDARVDTRRLLGDFKAAGEDVNSIGKGMARAVEERLKSERMKTELITNVSHDIKTPLTSIINYVDLMKKEPLETDTLRGYVEVVDRQAARLKKLLEDLIEASKASTGALSISPEPCELNVMLQQSAGEYAEKLAAAGLTPVLEHPQQPVYIMADGRHLARVFDNLLGNACKYSQPGTRLYLTLKETGGKAAVTFRNISREALHTDGDELMERFVRGDRSRHTEGSGLGLSIARSLVELQGGAMKLVVDGDLFKVTLVFPSVSAAAAAQALQESAPEYADAVFSPLDPAAIAAPETAEAETVCAGTDAN